MKKSKTSFQVDLLNTISKDLLSRIDEYFCLSKKEKQELEDDESEKLNYWQYNQKTKLIHQSYFKAEKIIAFWKKQLKDINIRDVQSLNHHLASGDSVIDLSRFAIERDQLIKILSSRSSATYRMLVFEIQVFLRTMEFYKDQTSKLRLYLKDYTTHKTHVEYFKRIGTDQKILKRLEQSFFSSDAFAHYDDIKKMQIDQATYTLITDPEIAHLIINHNKQNQKHKHIEVIRLWVWSTCKKILQLDKAKFPNERNNGLFLSYLFNHPNLGGSLTAGAARKSIKNKINQPALNSYITRLITPMHYYIKTFPKPLPPLSPSSLINEFRVFYKNIAICLGTAWCNDFQEKILEDEDKREEEAPLIRAKLFITKLSQ